MLKSITVVSYISAKAFDKKLTHVLEELERNNCEIEKIEFQHNWALYAASILYK